MLEAAVIRKDRSLHPTQDYAALRERGMSHVRELSAAIWTDHNLHDPGVTTLELLCYALTDLEYRTSFGIRDLLTPEDGRVDPPELSGLFPAHEVLTTAPLTIADYRRLLLKIEGVRNAWFDPMTDPAQVGNYRESEVPIYADCGESALTFDPLNAQAIENVRVRLRGLYRVLLELDVDPFLGSLNEARLVYRVIGGPLKGVLFAIDSEDPAFATTDFTPDFSGVSAVTSLTGSGKHFFAEVALDTSANPVILKQLVISVLKDRPRPEAGPVPISVTELQAVLESDEVDGPLARFWQKQQARRRALQKVRCVLHAHRNLCEDFLSVETVRPDHLAVCADVGVTPEADLEAVQAAVFHAIEQYLNPPVRYFTLQEMVDEGLCGDEIFNRPYIDTGFRCGEEAVFTKPGFIKDEDLEKSRLRRFVYVSDLINLLMDVEGVVFVKNVQLRRYDGDGNPAGSSQRWCLEVTPLHQPVLAIEQSKILLFKNEIPYRARGTEFRRTLDHLRAMARKEAYVEPNQEYAYPEGRHRNPDRFYSIQHDFPQTYGIGLAGLPTTADATRVAQARQFKGYLTHFDQVLADYLMQLSNVRRLLSLDRTLEQTYFTRYLVDIAGVRDAFADEFYLDQPALQDEMTRTRLTEDEELFQERRSRLLDHLTARFAERFTDYALMMFDLQGDRLKVGRDLIDDKIDFLADYPQVSRDRGRSFNYRPQNPADVWETDNVAGLQKRVSRLLGIDDYTRRDLACAEMLELLFGTRKVGNDFRIEIKADDNSVLFKSAEVFPDRSTALSEAAKVFPLVRRESTYEIDASGGTGTVLFRMAGGGVTLNHDQAFDTEADAVGAIRAIVDRYDELLATDACEDEGFHLIEHILLRPLSDQDPLLDVCLDPSCDSCGEEDPYSFRIQVVLPYWTSRFRNLDFRRFFERTLREETPAHIHARICWVSNEHMAELDAAYRAWLALRADESAGAVAQRNALAALIDILQRLRNVYPAATLHDCAEGEDENIVRLGSTNLGIF